MINVLARYLTLSFIFRDGRAALPPPLPRRPPVVNRRRRNAFRPPVPEKALQISWLSSQTLSTVHVIARYNGIIMILHPFPYIYTGSQLRHFILPRSWSRLFYLSSLTIP